MSAAHHLWRRVLVRLRPADRRASSPGDEESALLVLTDEFAANDRALRDLLAGDGRDTADVPGFDALADRQADLLELIVATPARGLAGLVAKARCARLRPARAGLRRRPELWRSPPSDDLLRLVGAAALSLTRPGPPSLDPSRAAAAELPPKKKEADMTAGRPTPPVASPSCVATTVATAEHHAIPARRVVAGRSRLLPFYRLPLPWFVIAALGAVGVGTISLAFFVLRFIDHSE